MKVNCIYSSYLKNISTYSLINIKHFKNISNLYSYKLINILKYKSDTKKTNLNFITNWIGIVMMKNWTIKSLSLADAKLKIRVKSPSFLNEHLAP